mmetsp:Transcript_97226/g.278311  ORF Transcript_97226/g.278311 Transcript_97226/m.278311 type:complete len:447 (+) Transcript_97226:67-1407(+)|eukprot:CAMPEP_0119535880 /NCGR_PEP_ID=MMETSP1344-20130328/48849_1 /TAXON_ID=236787 /ORGANISM="Florenciella parvula, Strain CCMP2471" /LENGTH=446 /DNA_ID=CAMNT_0007577701 /DNA_START=67 /DNA_END=1407 /DNA_ORIENTATION=-
MSTALKQLSSHRIAAGIGRMTDLVFERGAGSYIWTADGDKYLDMTCGIGVTNTGHCHPKVVEACQQQIGTLIHGQVNIAYHKPMLELCERLGSIMPYDLDTFFFWNSGAEAVEAAIKLARHATKRPNVIVFQGGYHGRTIGTMSLTTSKRIYRAGYGPLMPGVHVSPFPYAHQWQNAFVGDGGADDVEARCVAHALEQLELLFKQQADPNEIAAMIIEPVQGEGGYVPVPPAFMQGLRSICDAHGILLVADEVQSGFGRTGTMFACEDEATGARPDILVFAKGIASGMPLSGIASRKELMDLQPAGSQGGTYAGNAVACAAANATIDVMLEEGLLANTLSRGEQFMGGLRAIQAKYPGIISDVRGRGLMIGLEFNGDGSAVSSGVSIGPQVSARCLEKGMLLLTTSVYDTLRFIPPLTVSEAEVDEALAIFEEALAEVVASEEIAA